MTRKPFAIATQPPGPPRDLGIKLILFSGIEEQEDLSVLNGKLLLTSEDEPGSDYVFGYILNNPLPERLRAILKQAGVKDAPVKTQFMQIFYAAMEGLEPLYEEEYITLLARSNNPVGTSNEFIFGPFAAYSCETAEEAAEMIKLLNGREVITLSSLSMIDRAELVNLINNKKARIRDADPDIVFNRSGFMRAQLAFPDP